LVEATLDYLRQGGWVMLPLVGVSLVMWTLLVERWRYLREMRGRDLDSPGVLAVCRGEQDVPDFDGVRARLASSFAVALLGTVLGMIETFQVISDFGTGNARALAGGISVALVTTQTGLLVAIPGLLASSRLRRIAEELKLSLAETAQMIDRDLTRRGGVRKRGRRSGHDQH